MVGDYRRSGLKAQKGLMGFDFAVSRGRPMKKQNPFH
jgi:hypothetical protein